MSPAATVDQLEVHRKALTGHCYRMLGSVVDADDAVQETMLRAWRALDRFDGRSSLRTWLYRIATNVCLDALTDESRRFRPMESGPVGSPGGALVQRPRRHWLEPVPDAKALPDDANPAELAVLRQSIRLAFVAALQHLPPRQRAALLYVEVLGWAASEVAEALDMSLPAVNSALQRARATLAGRTPEAAQPAALSGDEGVLLERYVSAFERYDVDALASLLREDATFSMPPFELWLQGPAAVREWLLGRGSVCRGSRLLPASTCGGAPAFGHYHPRPEGGFAPWAVIVLELDGDRISGWNSFLDAEALFPHFGLPPELSS